MKLNYIKKYAFVHLFYLMKFKDAEEKSRMLRKASVVGYQEEDDLILQTTNTEMLLKDRIHDLEMDVRNIKNRHDRQMEENDKLVQQLTEKETLINSLDNQRRDLKAEVKTLKNKETQMIGDNSDLAEENLCLQKQILHLKKAQVHFI